MVVNTIGDTNNGTGACSQMSKTVIATIEIDVKKLRNYKQLYQISLFFLHSSKCVYLQPRDVHRSISKMVKTVAL